MDDNRRVAKFLARFGNLMGVTSRPSTPDRHDWPTTTTTTRKETP